MHFIIESKLQTLVGQLQVLEHNRDFASAREEIQRVIRVATVTLRIPKFLEEITDEVVDTWKLAIIKRLTDSIRERFEIADGVISVSEKWKKILVIQSPGERVCASQC